MSKMNNKGMTLVETIVAIFLVAIAGVLLVTGLNTATRVMKDAHIYKNVINDELDSINSGDAKNNVIIENRPNEVIVITANGNSQAITGTLVTASSSRYNIRLSRFVIPKEIVRNKDLYNHTLYDKKHISR